MHIDVWRMSASRPWQLEKTHEDLVRHLRYSGKLRFHLIESVLVPEYSELCIQFAKEHGYTVSVIHPAKGQGFAMDYALKNVITSKYALKWEDDFKPVKDIPLDDCVKVMEAYQNVNQICFNKRETMSGKEYRGPGGITKIWPKEQRQFTVPPWSYPMVVKEKWWFGTALWRMEYIKPLFQYWPHNTHNLMNDHVLMPLARVGSTSQERDQNGMVVPSVRDIEEKVGCYIWGKTGDPPMVEHTGIGDSIWAGEFQKRMVAEGKRVVGV